MDDQYSISGLAAFFFPVLDVDSDWRHLLYLSLKASLPSHVNEIGSFFLGLRKLQNSIYTDGIRRSCQDFSNEKKNCIYVTHARSHE